ncbi:MAG: NAD-dependent epimerase/dehydratase family protein [Microthrixaceae bacterium]
MISGGATGSGSAGSAATGAGDVEPKRVLVTGCAGFIGSHTTERLLEGGHTVRGVDMFTDNYDPDLKRANLRVALKDPAFELIEVDLVEADPVELLDGIDVVLHLAGQPGVRASWADGFDIYVKRNIEATQRLLEAARGSSIERFAAASSSSVYGDAETYPTAETAVPKPVSPYGVTKLAAEHLCTLYASNFGVPTVSLRYFTVFGPRQRTDMALRRMIDSALNSRPFPLYGDGSVSRSFTYIDDVVDANLAAMFHDVSPGTVCNVANVETASMSELISLAESALGSKIELEMLPDAAGDARQTGGSTEFAAQALGWAPKTSLATGVTRQVEWQRENPLPPDHPDMNF